MVGVKPLASMMTRRLPRWLLHLLFVVGMLLFMNAVGSAFYDWRVSTIRALFNTPFHLAVIYLTAYGLFPRLFKQKHYFAFFIGSILLIVGTSVLRRQLELHWLPSHLFYIEGIKPIVQEQGTRVFTFFSTFGMWLCTFNFCLIGDWFRRQQLAAALEAEKLDTELRFLKSQINPHFLFNTLHNLYSLCYLKDERAAPMVLKLSDMLRYTLYECDTPYIELEKEVRLLENYVALQSVKVDYPLPVSFSVNGSDINGSQLPPLLLLPLVENAFKHSDINSNPTGFVRIALQVANEQLSVQIENSKRKTPAPRAESSGIGLQNVQKRLALLFPDEFSLDISETPNVFCLTLQLPLLCSTAYSPMMKP